MRRAGNKRGAVAVDLDVIASAPRSLNIAGFGDMSGILISSVDWFASNIFVSEFFPEKIDLDRCYPSEQETFKEVEKRFRHLKPDGKSIFSSGNPTLPEDLTPPISPGQMKFAFLNARFMTNRFIIADIMGVVRDI